MLPGVKAGMIFSNQKLGPYMGTNRTFVIVLALFVPMAGCLGGDDAEESTPSQSSSAPTWADWALFHSLELDSSDSTRSLAVSPDGDILAFGSRDTTIRIWDVLRWRELSTLWNLSLIHI